MMKQGGLARIAALLLLLGLLTAIPVLAQSSPPEMTTSEHIVQPGETLPALAARYRTEVATLLRLNGLHDPRAIYPGQRLRYPAPTGARAAADLAAWRPYRARWGESLLSLARRAAVPWETIAQVNDLLHPGALLPGQSLLLPPLTPAHPVTSTFPATRLDAAIRHGVGYGQMLPLNPHPPAGSDGLLLPGDGVNGVNGMNGMDQHLPPPLASLELSSQPVVRGQTMILSMTTTISATCDVTYLNQTAPCYTDDAHHLTALLGIPTLTEPGRYEATLRLTPLPAETNAPVILTLPLHIDPGRYDYERLDLPPDRQSLLDPALAREENNKIAALRTYRTPERYGSLRFELPVEASITSYFGSRRSYGGPFSSYHGGNDFRAEVGAPVIAPAGGVVVLAEPLVVRGNAVIIDHGWGVMTGYWHLSRIDVAAGDAVIQGEVIAAVGNTGLSTGPHLHWELWVNGVSVDALPWLDDFGHEK